MNQFITGELFIYIDQLMTLEDAQIQSFSKFAEIEQIVNRFIDLFLCWVQVLPEIESSIQFFQSHKNLYQVCPEAAIYGLKDSLILSMNLIFSYNERSRQLNRKLPSLIKGLTFPKGIEPIDRSLNQLNALFFGRFLTIGGI